MTVAPAAACPRGTACLATVTREVAPADRAPARPVQLAPTISPRSTLDHALRTYLAPRAPELEMPWIWQVLRAEVYARMPRYEERTLTMTLQPLVVSGTFDTVPGVGVGGEF